MARKTSTLHFEPIPFAPPPSASIEAMARLLDGMRMTLKTSSAAPSETEQELRQALDVAWISALRLAAEIQEEPANCNTAEEDNPLEGSDFAPHLGAEGFYAAVKFFLRRHLAPQQSPAHAGAMLDSRFSHRRKAD